ncbi:MAG: peptide chain release factor N(5)-glutamine methyltransferase [Hyphomicrobiales bacterium]
MRPDTVAAALAEGRRFLDGAGISSAALDARLLLQAALGASHESLVSGPERPLRDDELPVYQDLLDRRRAREPVSRILGIREFYGREFKVTPAVLDPRPDTETLVEAALSRMPPDEPSSIVDLGAGSGAIMITLLAERSAATGTATDSSPATLAIARENAARHGVEKRLRFVGTNWWDGLSGTFDVIVSNPPYIPTSALRALPPEVGRYDPLGALDGGPDGLSAFRRIASGALHHLAPKGRLLVEIGEGQDQAVRSIFSAKGLVPSGSWHDLAGRVRCLGFVRPT